MARLLVQLKLRLLLNALRSSDGAKISFIVSSTFAVLLAIGTFLVLAGFHGKGTAVELTSVVFTVFAFGWLIAPIMIFGLDGTLDPATLALYPLRTRQLAVGLLAASMAGFWPFANVVGLLGVTVGLARGGLGVLVAVIAVVLQVLFCVALARLVTTSLAGLLRSRRGRDLAALLIVPVFALYELFTQAAGAGRLSAARFAALDAWLRWLPPGLAAHAIADASDGHPGLALARLAALAAVIAVLVWLWVRALSAALVTADTTTQSSRVRGRGLPLSGFGLGGTVAARFWLYQRREPILLVYWAMAAVITVVPAISSIIGHPRHPAVVLASAVFGSAFVGIFRANGIGLTGPAFALEAVALSRRRDLRAYFSGQNLVLGAIGTPLIVAICFALGALAGDPGRGVEATPVVLAGVGAALGLSTVCSVAMPYPVVKRVGSPFPVPAPGYSGYRFSGLLALVGTGVLAAPAIAAAVLTAGGPLGIRVGVLVPAAAVYGWALAVIGGRLAAIIAQRTLPDLCQVALRTAA